MVKTLRPDFLETPRTWAKNVNFISLSLFRIYIKQEKNQFQSNFFSPSKILNSSVLKIKKTRQERTREKETDPELTFHPNIYHSKNSQFYYGEDEIDIIERTQLWQKKRSERLAEAKMHQQSKEQFECTFTPSISQTIPEFVPEGVSDFNRRGIIEYFERLEQAKSIKAQKER